MPGKWCLFESVVGQGNRKTRSLGVKLDCLNSNPDVVFVPIHRKKAWNRCRALDWHAMEWPSVVRRVIDNQEPLRKVAEEYGDS